MGDSSPESNVWNELVNYIFNRVDRSFEGPRPFGVAKSDAAIIKAYWDRFHSAICREDGRRIRNISAHGIAAVLTSMQTEHALAKAPPSESDAGMDSPEVKMEGERIEVFLVNVGRYSAFCFPRRLASEFSSRHSKICWPNMRRRGSSKPSGNDAG